MHTSSQVRYDLDTLQLEAVRTLRTNRPRNSERHGHGAASLGCERAAACISLGKIGARDDTCYVQRRRSVIGKRDRLRQAGVTHCHAAKRYGRRRLGCIRPRNDADPAQGNRLRTARNVVSEGDQGSARSYLCGHKYFAHGAVGTWSQTRTTRSGLRKFGVFQHPRDIMSTTEASDSPSCCPVWRTSIFTSSR